MKNKCPSPCLILSATLIAVKLWRLGNFLEVRQQMSTRAWVLSHSAYCLKGNILLLLFTTNPEIENKKTNKQKNWKIHTSHRRRGRFLLYRMEQQLMGKQSPTEDIADLNFSELEGWWEPFLWDFKDPGMYRSCVSGIAVLRSNSFSYFEYLFFAGKNAN